MNCTKCNKKLPDNSKVCKYCGLDFETGEVNRVYIHPKAKILGFRIANIICYLGIIALALMPWLSEGGLEYFSSILMGTGFLKTPSLNIIDVIFSIVKYALLACSAVYIVSEIAVIVREPKKPVHIIFSKIFSSVFLVLMLLVFITIALLVYNETLDASLPYSKWFYYTIVMLSISRGLVVKEYISGYVQNKKMEVLDDKYNSWMKK